MRHRTSCPSGRAVHCGSQSPRWCDAGGTPFWLDPSSSSALWKHCAWKEGRDSTEEISGAIHYAPALLMWLRHYSTLWPQVLLLGFSGLKNMKSVTFMQDFSNILVAKLADICPTWANQGLGNLTGRVGC